MTNAIRRSVTETFDQDRVVLEAQQIEVAKIGSADPGMVLGIDAGPVRGRHMLVKALAAEQAVVIPVNTVNLDDRILEETYR